MKFRRKKLNKCMDVAFLCVKEEKNIIDGVHEKQKKAPLTS
jgi:hypothetical protein